MTRPFSPRIGYALSFGSALAWSTTSVLIKYLLDSGAPRLAVAFWRDMLIAIACLLGLLLLRPRELRVARSDLGGFAAIGALSVGVYHALWVFSIGLNGAAVATVLIYTYPIFVMLGAWLLFHETISRKQVAALVVALIGCVLLVRAYDLSVLRLSWIGILIGLGTGFTHAGYVLFSQRSVQSYSPWTSLAYTMLFGSLMLLIINLMAEPTQVAAIGGLDSWGWLVLLALGPTLAGYAMFTIALRAIPGQIAGLIAIIEAPAAALFALLILGERLEWPQVVGMLLILGAVTFSQMANSTAQPTAESIQQAA